VRDPGTVHTKRGLLLTTGLVMGACLVEMESELVCLFACSGKTNDKSERSDCQ
jgi:hypothetical protein